MTQVGSAIFMLFFSILFWVGCGPNTKRQANEQNEEKLGFENKDDTEVPKYCIQKDGQISALCFELSQYATQEDLAQGTADLKIQAESLEPGLRDLSNKVDNLTSRHAEDSERLEGYDLFLTRQIVPTIEKATATIMPLTTDTVEDRDALREQRKQVESLIQELQ